jgi:NADPH:quinone reductase-like Zn-dependent oxidoreductase
MNSEAIYLIKKGAANQAFERIKLELPSLAANEVLVESEAFGLNYADVMARNGLYREAPPMPCVIGYELVGRVIEVGESVDKSMLGKRVLAFCRFGGYGKHVIAKDYGIVPIGDLPAETVMALCTQAVTAYYMSDVLSPIQKGDKVLIHAAAGGVGTILIQLAKRRGAYVIAKIGNASKTQLVKDLGADFVVNYNETDYQKTIFSHLKGDRLDVSYNPVAGSTFKKDMALIGSGGRLFIFGGSELIGGKFGVFSSLNFVRKMGLILPIGLMMRSKNILGVNMLKIADNRPMIIHDCLVDVVDLFLKGEIIPQVGAVYPVSKIVEAHALLESGKSTGKITVVWEN